MASGASHNIIEARGLMKEFGGFIAVDDVNLDIRRGTIHALIGPNGAGKTTVFNLLTKFLQPSSGRITFNGHDITNARPADVAAAGMVRSFQISAVFPQLTAAENVRIALHRKWESARRLWRSSRLLAEMEPRIFALLQEVGLEDAADQLAGEMAYGRRRALEIATTLALEPEMLLLDEPTSGMGREDIQRVAELIRRVAATRTVLMVEHNLSVVSGLSDTITVLARGRVLAEGSYAEVSRNPAVVEAYLGSDHA
jgi:branched-chain amino acid transport system ATP-binding protein